MKTQSLLAGLLIAASGVVFAAPNESEAPNKQLEIYPKNLARQHVGTNLFVFNSTNQNYVPTEASAAWLDDDVATGWPPLPGKNFYLLSLAEPQLLSNLAISTKAGAGGTVTIYAGDEPAPPTAKSWTVLAKDISVDSINDKKMAKPFSRYAKYILIETNLADPSPWYSIYLYGDKPAVAYHIEKRSQGIDTKSVFGPFVNNQTVFNLSSLYAKSMVSFANTSSSMISMQKSIDDNPETTINIAPSKDSGLIVKYGETRQVQRLSISTDQSAKGRLDFYLVSNLPDSGSQVPAPAPVTSNDEGSHYTKVVNTSSTPAGQTAGGPVSLDKLTPTVSMVLDGSNGRGSIDFPPVTAGYMIVRWMPEAAGQNLSIHEINSFGDVSLSDFELISNLPAVGEAPAVDGKDAKDMGDSKDKQGPDPVGELLPGKDPFLPAGLGFPPNMPNPLSP